MDTPVLNASNTTVPGNGGSFLEVIANSGIRVAYAVDYLDTTGENIGIYTGQSGQEILRCILGGGAISRAHVVIAANSRVSLRSMGPADITNGKLVMTLMGMGWGPM